MDPITSPDPTPQWREGNYPFLWSLIAPGGVTPIAPTFDKRPQKRTREGYRVNPREEIYRLSFPVCPLTRHRGKRRELKHAGNHRHKSTVYHRYREPPPERLGF